MLTSRAVSSHTASSIRRAFGLRHARLERHVAMAAAHTQYSPTKWWSKQDVAVVTGSNKGIGKEIARLLAEQGITVVATARNVDLGQAAVKDISAAAGPDAAVDFHQLDVSDAASIAAFKTWLQDTYDGRLSVLVNNAGIAYKGDTFGAQELKTTLATNYTGTAALTEALLPLIKPGQGRVVTVSSRAGLTGILRSPQLQQQFMSAGSQSEIDALVEQFVKLVEDGGNLAAAGWPRSMYGISKLAVSMYCRTLALRVKGQGILVAACCPGYCATDMSSWRGTQSAAAGADTPVWLALQPADQLETGRLWGERTALKY